MGLGSREKDFKGPSGLLLLEQLVLSGVALGNQSSGLSSNINKTINK